MYNINSSIHAKVPFFNLPSIQFSSLKNSLLTANNESDIEK